MTAALIHISRHPLILHRLAGLREDATFRRLVPDLAEVLFLEGTPATAGSAPCEYHCDLPLIKSMTGASPEA